MCSSLLTTDTRHSRRNVDAPSGPGPQRGADPHRARIPVAVYAERESERELLVVEELPDRVPGRYSSDSLLIEVAMRDVDRDPIVVRVDDDGTGTGIQPECDEDDNEAVIESLCD
jgi:hypothetical protein